MQIYTHFLPLKRDDMLSTDEIKTHIAKIEQELIKYLWDFNSICFITTPVSKLYLGISPTFVTFRVLSGLKNEILYELIKAYLCKR
jgi:hypothetical protein